MILVKAVRMLLVCLNLWILNRQSGCQHLAKVVITASHGCAFAVPSEDSLIARDCSTLRVRIEATPSLVVVRAARSRTARLLGAHSRCKLLLQDYVKLLDRLDLRHGFL